MANAGTLVEAVALASPAQLSYAQRGRGRGWSAEPRRRVTDGFVHRCDMPSSQRRLKRSLLFPQRYGPLAGVIYTVVFSNRASHTTRLACARREDGAGS